MPKDKRAKDTLFHRIPTCNAHLKQLSRIKKHKISSAVLRKSNRIWNESARWIGCCAVMLATEKPRWRFALHSKPLPMENKLHFLFRRRFLPSSIWKHYKNAAKISL